MQNLGYMPTDITAGETIWIAEANTIQGAEDIVLSDYTPADGSTLAYQFAAETPITVDAAANGADTGWTLEVTAAQTLLWKAPTLAYSAYVTDSNGRVFLIDQGSMAITNSPLATSAWTAIVAACDAAILAYAGNPNGSFTVDGMSISYRSLSQLTDLRTYAKGKEQEEIGGRQKRIIRTRFT